MELPTLLELLPASAQRFIHEALYCFDLESCIDPEQTPKHEAYQLLLNAAAVHYLEQTASEEDVIRWVQFVHAAWPLDTFQRMWLFAHQHRDDFEIMVLTRVPMWDTCKLPVEEYQTGFDVQMCTVCNDDCDEYDLTPAQRTLCIATSCKSCVGIENMLSYLPKSAQQFIREAVHHDDHHDLDPSAYDNFAQNPHRLLLTAAVVHFCAQSASDEDIIRWVQFVHAAWPFETFKTMWHDAHRSGDDFEDRVTNRVSMWAMCKLPINEYQSGFDVQICCGCDHYLVDYLRDLSSDERALCTVTSCSRCRSRCHTST